MALPGSDGESGLWPEVGPHLELGTTCVELFTFGEIDEETTRPTTHQKSTPTGLQGGQGGLGGH